MNKLYEDMDEKARKKHIDHVIAHAQATQNAVEVRKMFVFMGLVGTPTSMIVEALIQSVALLHLAFKKAAAEAPIALPPVEDMVARIIDHAEGRCDCEHDCRKDLPRLADLEPPAPKTGGGGPMVH